MTTKPSGLSKSDASLARNLFGAKPAEMMSPVSANTRSLIARPKALGPVNLWVIPVTSKKASSNDNGSIRGVNSSITL